MPIAPRLMVRLGRAQLFPFALSRNSEEVMNEPKPIRDPNLLRFVQDFDALADLVHTLIDQNRRRVHHETLSAAEMEFTTEWQMEPSAGATHSL
jgi:hypothetical protein